MTKVALAERPLRPSSRTDTTPEWNGTSSVRRARWVRRGLLALFTAVLLLGATGMLGVRTATVSASGGGYELTLHYAKVSRPGHSSPWYLEVRKAGGFGEDPVTIATTHEYFDMFDENGVNPGPSKETTSGDLLVWEFDPPDGDLLRVRLDTRVGPNRQAGRAATTSVLVDDVAVVSVTYRTRLVP